MSISCDGPCRSSNDCAAGQPEHGGGWTPFDGTSPPCSRTGTCCHPPHAGLWEPYDGRPSRTVLRGREGEAPSRYSPGHPARNPSRSRSLGGRRNMINKNCETRVLLELPEYEVATEVRRRVGRGRVLDDDLPEREGGVPVVGTVLLVGLVLDVLVEEEWLAAAVDVA